MEALALSIDRCTVEDLVRTSAPSVPECRQGQLPESTGVSQHYTTLFDKLPHTGEPVVSSESSDCDQEDAGMTGTLLEDIIGEYVPKGSDLELAARHRRSSSWFVRNDGTVWGPRMRLALDGMEAHHGWWESDSSTRKGLLIVQDINLEWCMALHAKYPEALPPEHLVGHVVRFEEDLLSPENSEHIQSDLRMRYPDSGVTVSSEGNFMAIKMHYGPQCPTRPGTSFDINLTLETPSAEARAHLSALHTQNSLDVDLDCRQDVFEKGRTNTWRRISARTSFFRLETDLCKTGHVNAFQKTSLLTEEPRSASP